MSRLETSDDGVEDGRVCVVVATWSRSFSLRDVGQEERVHGE